jgi:hypothetical protein
MTWKNKGFLIGCPHKINVYWHNISNKIVEVFVFNLFIYKKNKNTVKFIYCWKKLKRQAWSRLINLSSIDWLRRSNKKESALGVYCFTTPSPAEAKLKLKIHRSQHTMDSKNVVVCDNGTGVLFSHQSLHFISKSNRIAMDPFQEILKHKSKSQISIKL